MGKQWIGFLLFVFLVSSSGCSGRAPVMVKDDSIATGYPPNAASLDVESESVPRSPYPPPNSSWVSGDEALVPTPYPESQSLAENVTPSSTVAPPSSLVDISMRATDPSEFVMDSGGYQLVQFFAFWCPTCKSMAPVLRKLEIKYAGRIRFFYLDIDDPKTNPIKQALGYQFQPHLFLIDGTGKTVKQWIGYVTEEELDATLSSLP